MDKIEYEVGDAKTDGTIMMLEDAIKPSNALSHADGWQEKIWGRTRCSLDSLVYSKHELELKAGTFCSVHYHRFRGNKFVLFQGSVRIVWSYAWKIESKTLKPGDALHIPSLVVHQFQVLEDGVMTEEYYPERGGKVEHGDIVRLCEGGSLAHQCPLSWRSLMTLENQCFFRTGDPGMARISFWPGHGRMR